MKTLQQFLHESRLVTTRETRKKRGRKLQISPGKGMNHKNLVQTSSEEETEDENYYSENSEEELDAEEEMEIEHEQAVTKETETDQSENDKTDFPQK